MILLWIVLALLALALLAALGFSLYMAQFFLHRKRKQKPCPSAYKPHMDELYAAYDALKAQGLEEHFCRSEGKTVYADFMPQSSDKAAVLLHGVLGRGRDRAMDARYYLDRGYSVLMPDLRGCGRSEGRYCGMGMYTREDMLVWFELLKARLGADVKIVVDGISMGAGSALLIAGDGKCPNVKAVIADAPFSSFKEMCRDIFEKRKFPKWLFPLLYPPERFWCRVLLGKDLKKAAPAALMEQMRTPVLFLHGEADAFVPCEMSRRMFERCASEKKALLTLPEVPHVGMRVMHRTACENKMDELLSDIM